MGPLRALETAESLQIWARLAAPALNNWGGRRRPRAQVFRQHIDSITRTDRSSHLVFEHADVVGPARRRPLLFGLRFPLRAPRAMRALARALQLVESFFRVRHQHRLALLADAEPAVVVALVLLLQAPAAGVVL